MLIGSRGAAFGQSRVTGRETHRPHPRRGPVVSIGRAAVQDERLVPGRPQRAGEVVYVAPDAAGMFMRQLGRDDPNAHSSPPVA